MKSRRMFVSAVLLLVSGATSTPGRAAAGTPCQEIDYGPETSAKPVVVCVAYASGRPTVRVSADLGRTWSAKSAVGTPDGLDHLLGVLVSPHYDTDRTIYLQYQSYGLFASSDGGATFVPADPQAGTQADQRVTRIDRFGPAEAELPAEPAIAQPGPRAVYLRMQHVPVVGSGNRQELAFRQLGHGASGVVLNVSHGPEDNTGPWRVRISRCTPEITCLDGRLLPADHRFVELAADPAPTGRTAVALFTGTRRDPVVWASTDQGRTFVRNVAFDRLVAKLVRGVDGRFADAVSVLPGGKAWVVHFGTSKKAYLIVSTDGGRTWSTRAAPSRSRRIVATRDGRLLGADPDFSCSRDLGRRWSRTCPR